MLSYTLNAIHFSYTRTLQGLELKVCGFGLGLRFSRLDCITDVVKRLARQYSIPEQQNVGE